MGTIIKVKGADYSQNSVGKYDFATEQIFSRRDDGSLDKLAMYNPVNKSLGNASHGLSVFDGINDVEILIAFKYSRRTGIKNLFKIGDNNFSIQGRVIEDAGGDKLAIDVEDYENTRRRTTVSTATLKAATSIAEPMIGDNNVLRLKLKLPAAGDPVKYVMSDFILNGVSTTPSASSLSPFGAYPGQILVLGSNKLVALGTPDADVAYGLMYFVQVKKAGSEIIRFDFSIGANDAERLTDKINGVVLSKYGAFGTESPFRYCKD